MQGAFFVHSRSWCIESATLLPSRYAHGFSQGLNFLLTVFITGTREDDSAPKVLHFIFNLLQQNTSPQLLAYPQVHQESIQIYSTSSILYLGFIQQVPFN